MLLIKFIHGGYIMNNKNGYTANFNVVFGKGKEEKPLLDYFDTIVMPTLLMDVKKKIGDNEYKIINVEVENIAGFGMVLKGVLVKNTLLEIKSRMKMNGEMLEINELYPSSPYSIFIISLKNHRMILVKNQKGSPDIRSFSSVFKSLIASYTRDENRRRKSNEEPLLPEANINIVGLPIKESIEDYLRDVKKINKLTLKFYPLNGDIDISDIFQGITTEVRQIVGSETGHIVLNSPTSVNGIVEVLEDAYGTVEAKFNVTYNDNNKGVINNGNISEKIQIPVKSESFVEMQKELIDSIVKIENLKKTSKQNLQIYNMNNSKIVKFLKK